MKQQSAQSKFKKRGKTILGKENTERTQSDGMEMKADDNIDDNMDRLSVYEPKRFEKVKLAAELPAWEMYLYIGCIIGCVTMSAYALYKFSEGMQREGAEVHPYLDEGWSLFGRLQDTADYDWDIWRHSYKILFFVTGLHSVVSLVSSRYVYKFRRHAWLVVGVASCLLLLGWKAIVFNVFIMATLFITSLSGSVALTWIVAFSWLSLYNYQNCDWMSHLLTQPEEDETTFGLLYFSSGFGILRAISFSIEKAKRIQGSSDLHPDITFSVFDCLVYLFYLPNYFVGPLFIYKYFQSEVQKTRMDWTKAEVFDVLQKFARSFFWVVFCDGFLNFIYIHSIIREAAILRMLPLWALGGMVVYVSSFYQAKYCAVYGTGCSFMMVDRIVPPTNPRCIIRVVYFSEHWRFFDPGLHAFFRKPLSNYGLTDSYIYIPLGGSRHGWIRQSIATFVTFSFVAFWHGAKQYLFFWSMSNCLGVFIEILATKFVTIPKVALFEETYFGPAMTRRVHALFNFPLYVFSIHAIMVFYSSIVKGWVFFDRLILQATPLSIATLCSYLYTTTLFSQEVERWEQNKLHRKVKDE